MRISDWSSDVCSSDLPLIRLSPALSPVASCSQLLPRMSVRSLPPARRNMHWYRIWRFRLRRSPEPYRVMLRLPAYRPAQPHSCGAHGQIGRAQVGTPVTNAHIVCRLLLEQNNNTTFI